MKPDSVSEREVQASTRLAEAVEAQLGNKEFAALLPAACEMPFRRQSKASGVLELENCSLQHMARLERGEARPRWAESSGSYCEEKATRSLWQGEALPTCLRSVLSCHRSTRTCASGVRRSSSSPGRTPRWAATSSRPELIFVAGALVCVDESWGGNRPSGRKQKHTCRH